MAWGVEAKIVERFGAAGVAPEKITTVLRADKERL